MGRIIDPSGSGWVPVSRFCENGNEPSSSLGGEGEFLV